MRLRSRAESAQVIVLILIVLAILGGGWWFLKNNRDRREQEAWNYARESARHIVLMKDVRYLDFNLPLRAQAQYPPSWRMRLMERIDEAGAANPDFQLAGHMQFERHFFSPSGIFTANFSCATGPAILELHVSHPGALWVIDDLNWTWTPAPTPTPTPVATPTPTPSPTPSPTPNPKQHGHR